MDGPASSPRRGLIAEIEGLRALAVLAVLAYHAFPALVPGGFCGVDIFFVVSGYVVGGRLLDHAAAGRLSFRRFYEARARRLLPALVIVVAAAFAAGWWLLSGPELASLGKHMAATAALANNFVLAGEAGYFDAPSASKPLLHLWSLAIEAQFYLVAPLLVGWAVRVGSGSASRWLLRLGALSLLWLVVRQDAEPGSMFYDPSFRFWEIAAGTALAAWKRRPAEAPATPLEARVWGGALLFCALLPLLGEVADAGWARSPMRAAALAILVVSSLVVVAFRRVPGSAASSWGSLRPWCGMVLIGASLATAKPGDWPSVETLLPVLGTVLVLSHPGGFLLSPLLRSRPAVFVGGISYPLYLWHWPVLVYARLVLPDLGAAAFVALLAFAGLLAWATKVLVEDPVRRGRLGARQFPRVRLGLPFAAAIGLAASGIAAVASAGIPGRLPPNLRALASWQEPLDMASWRVGKCHHFTVSSAQFAPECSPAARSDRPTVLLWGDSHAAHLLPGLRTLEQRDAAFQLAQWTVARCPPTLHGLPSELAACRVRRGMDWSQLAAYRPDGVVLAGAWALYLRSGVDASVLVQEVAQTVAALRAIGVKQVVVVGPGPVWKTAVSTEMFRSAMRAYSRDIPVRYAGAAQDLRELDAAIARAAQASGAKYFSVMQTLCSAQDCRVIGDAALPVPDLLFFDTDHLSRSGSRLVAEELRPVLAFKARDVRAVD